jgi:D-alanyl-D-alanine carboxypeptidase/D-alanyl-D-alanine-endopeptidase (penicillin-binding protein 4)
LLVAAGGSRPCTWRRRIAIVGVAAMLLAAARVGAEHPQHAAESAAAAVRARLMPLLANLPADTSVGLFVADSDSGTPWFAHQPDRPLKPASVMKLFVTAAALERFGPDFAYETRLYTWNDELLVVGGGDPGLGDDRLAVRHGKPLHAEFDIWAQRLRQRGITKLQKIALDDSVFDRQSRHPDWPDEQAQAWYQAPVGGLNFNDNCLDARARVVDGQLVLSLQPDLPASFLRNTLRLSARHDPKLTRAFDEDVFEFSGPIARDHEFPPVSVRRPTVFFGHALRQALEQRGIVVAGPVVRRTITPATLAEANALDVRTTPLADVLWRTNTLSQNLFAECLLKSLGAYAADGRRSLTPGSWEGGVRVLKATLQGLGLDLDGAIFRDGSGLSHENRVTAGQVARLLMTMRDHRHSALFIGSLARPGEEGTMRRRYASERLRGRLRAKTGTIRGVRALAGYVERSDGVTLAFALLINGSPPQSLPTRVAEALLDGGSN